MGDFDDSQGESRQSFVSGETRDNDEYVGTRPGQWKDVNPTADELFDE